MSSTQDEILQLADHLLRDRGINGFSYHDIAQSLGVKNAAIHYHFPTKTDLVVSVIRQHRKDLGILQEKMKEQAPQMQLKAFFSIYQKSRTDNRVCIVGSLATDLHTVSPPIATELKALANSILEWVTQILETGREQGIFHFEVSPRAKALTVVGGMLASLQIARLTHDADFALMQETLLRELNPLGPP